MSVQFTSSTFSFRMNPKGGNATNVQVRNYGTLTDELKIVESGTSTRVEMIDAQVSTTNQFNYNACRPKQFTRELTPLMKTSTTAMMRVFTSQLPSSTSNHLLPSWRRLSRFSTSI